jgi:hypothetical protein
VLPDVLVVLVPDVLVALAVPVLELESLEEPPQPVNRAVAASIPKIPFSPSNFPISTIARLAFRLKFPEHSGDSYRSCESGMTVTRQSLRLSLRRQPRCLTDRFGSETGGFASPPCGGFALNSRA